MRSRSGSRARSRPIGRRPAYPRQLSQVEDQSSAPPSCHFDSNQASGRPRLTGSACSWIGKPLSIWLSFDRDCLCHPDVEDVMTNTKTLPALILLASMVGIGASQAAPLPTNVAAMKGMVESNTAHQVRWGGWRGGRLGLSRLARLRRLGRLSWMGLSRLGRRCRRCDRWRSHRELGLLWRVSLLWRWIRLWRRLWLRLLSAGRRLWLLRSATLRLWMVAPLLRDRPAFGDVTEGRAANADSRSRALHSCTRSHHRSPWHSGFAL
ncbi:cytochrome c553 [Bradyrhizobium sp. USDA 3256]